MQLDERVKACLQRKKFVLPQQARNVSEHFCNECATPDDRPCAPGTADRL